MKTRRIQCDSSVLDGVRYDPKNCNLDIKMKRATGSRGMDVIYRYKNVDAVAFAYFITSESLGKGYNELIKGKFKCLKLRRATL